jgi:hypothetical protein
MRSFVVGSVLDEESPNHSEYTAERTEIRKLDAAELSMSDMHFS